VIYVVWLTNKNSIVFCKLQGIIKLQLQCTESCQSRFSYLAKSVPCSVVVITFCRQSFAVVENKN